MDRNEANVTLPQDPPVSKQNATVSFIETADNQYRQKSFLLALGSYKQALDMISNSEHAEDISQKIVLYHMLGKASLKLVRFAEASNYLKDALHLNQSSKYSNLPRTAKLLLTLAKADAVQAKHAESLSGFLEALEILKTHFDENHREIGRCYNPLADLHRRQGDYDLGIECLEKAIHIFQLKKNAIELDKHLASSYYGLGRIQVSLANYQRARQWCNESLKIREQCYDQNHPKIALCINLIGNIHWNQSRYLEALSCFNAALQSRLETLDKNHPQIGDSYANIAKTQKVQGKYHEALGNYKKALEIRQYCFGTNHPDVADSYRDIASICNHQGNKTQAIENYSAALRIHEEYYGPKHPIIASDYRSLGAVYLKQGDYEGAEISFLKALEIKLGCFGPTSLKLVNTYNSLGTLYLNLDENEKALPQFVKTLKLQGINGGENYNKGGAPHYNMSLLFHRSKDLASAESNSQKALRIFQKNFGVAHNKAINVKANIEDIEYTTDLLDKNSNFSL